MTIFSFQSFVLGFASAVLFMQLLFAFGRKPIWYRRWRDRRWNKRFWASLSEESRSWNRRHLSKHELEKYEP